MAQIWFWYEVVWQNILIFHSFGMLIYCITKPFTTFHQILQNTNKANWPPCINVISTQVVLSVRLRVIIVVPWWVPIGRTITKLFFLFYKTNSTTKIRVEVIHLHSQIMQLGRLFLWAFLFDSSIIFIICLLDSK